MVCWKPRRISRVNPSATKIPPGVDLLVNLALVATAPDLRDRALRERVSARDRRWRRDQMAVGGADRGRLSRGSRQHPDPAFTGVTTLVVLAALAVVVDPRRLATPPVLVLVGSGLAIVAGAWAIALNRRLAASAMYQTRRCNYYN